MSHGDLTLEAPGSRTDASHWDLTLEAPGSRTDVSHGDLTLEEPAKLCQNACIVVSSPQ